MTDFAAQREKMGDRQLKRASRIGAFSMPSAVESGRLAYRAGRMGKRRYADPSSPLAGLI